MEEYNRKSERNRRENGKRRRKREWKEKRKERMKKERRKEPFGTVYHVITIIIVSRGKVVS